MLALSRGRIPVVAQVHYDLLSDAALPGGSALRALAGRARRATAVRLLAYYRAVRTVAPEMAARLRTLGARDVRCIPVPILDLATFSPGTAALSPGAAALSPGAAALSPGAAALSPGAAAPREPRVLFVGRLAPEKNLPLWLEVARRVRAELPSARFDIVGDGISRGRLMAESEALGLGSSIGFHGSKQRSELPEIYRSASVLLLTSDHEGFGRVLVEALAAGTAVVSTSTSGAREVLADGEAGIIAECGDAAALAQGVLVLLREPQRRAALVMAGRRRIEGRYDPLRLAREWIDMLVEAAELPPPTADTKRAS